MVTFKYHMPMQGLCLFMKTNKYLLSNDTPVCIWSCTIKQNLREREDAFKMENHA